MRSCFCRWDMYLWVVELVVSNSHVRSSDVLESNTIREIVDRMRPFHESISLKVLQRISL